MVNQEQESSHDGQQEQLYPHGHAAVHSFGLICRGSCRQRPGGAGRGGGGGQAGDSVDNAVLCVGGGGAGSLGDFWREEGVFIIPQVTGLHWAAGSSSNGSSTGGATRDNNFTVIVF